MTRINITCETCGLIHDVQRTSEIPDSVISMGCNWCALIVKTGQRTTTKNGIIITKEAVVFLPNQIHRKLTYSQFIQTKEIMKKKKTPFSQNLKWLRKKLNKMNQEDLAKKVGVSRAMIGFYENGQFEPNFKTLVKICRWFNVSIDDVLTKKITSVYPKVLTTPNQ